MVQVAQRGEKSAKEVWQDRMRGLNLSNEQIQILLTVRLDPPLRSYVIACDEQCQLSFGSGHAVASSLSYADRRACQTAPDAGSSPAGAVPPGVMIQCCPLQRQGAFFLLHAEFDLLRCRRA